VGVGTVLPLVARERMSIGHLMLSRAAALAFAIAAAATGLALLGSVPKVALGAGLGTYAAGRNAGSAPAAVPLLVHVIARAADGASGAEETAAWPFQADAEPVPLTPRVTRATRPIVCDPTGGATRVSAPQPRRECRCPHCVLRDIPRKVGAAQGRLQP
jgi:hypothetical protein